MKQYKQLWSALFIILHLSIPSYIYADNTVKRLSTIEGLSNNSVNCIYQDSEGIMWFGTWDGLNTYNGRDFKIYKYTNNEYSISNNVIRQIAESDPLHIWIATDDGINRWNRNTLHFDNYFVNIKQTEVIQEKSFLIGLTSSKDIICYVRSKGFFYFDDASNKFIPINNISFEDNVKNFVIDNNDHIYILFDNGMLDQYTISKKNSALMIDHHKMIDKANSVQNIFLTNNFLVLCYQGYIKIVDNYNQFPSAIDVNKKKTISQVVYRNSNFIISYLEGGCDTYNIKDKTLKPLKDFPQNISVFSMYAGNQDILWIGTDGQGIWQMYEYNSAFSIVRTNHPVRAFCEISDNKILVATKGDGLKLYDKTSKTLSEYATTANGLISNSVYCIQKNKHGDIFIGTEGNSINYISDNKLQTLELPDNTPVFRSVYSIAFSDNDSQIWLGTSGFGLIGIKLRKEGNKYIVEQIKQYSSSNSSKAGYNDIIYSISQGFSSETLWVGTRRGGLFRFNINNEKFENLESINKKLHLTNNDILSLNKESQSLWVGTSYGLNQVDLEKKLIRSYTEEQGIANNTIHGILYDGTNNLWISTNGGLSHINIEANSISNYTTKDGLQNNEFSDGAYYMDADSTFYFGGVNGFNYFQPNEIFRRNYNPDIVLSSLRIFNTPLNIYDRIKNNTLNLGYGEAYITFTFLAEDYINNENCEYSYRLLNFSDEWINNGQNPNIVLTNLPPGKYKLQVRATNGDRIWGDQIYTLHIDVAFPWWLSSWAIILYIIIAMSIAYIAYSVIRNRIRLNRQLLLEHVEKENQKKIHESKLNFFTNVAHEFFTPLTLIYGPAQHLLEKDDIDSYTKRYIHVIKNNADRMQKLISELMDFRKVESGHIPIHAEDIDMKLLLDYISDNYTEIAEQNKIDLQIITSGLESIRTDRSSIEKIIFNLISNAFKYTPSGGYIKIEAEQNDNMFRLIIKNSGKGLTEKQMDEIFNQFKIFDKPQLENSRSTGIGLNLVKSLVEMLGGSISVSSKLKEHVEFIVEISSLDSIQANLASETSNEPISLSTQIQERKDISILIVEDEKNIRELLKDILIPYYLIREAGDGKEALEEIAQNTPDIIISDVLMPNMDGMQLIDKLKTNPKTAHIPIINISAKSSLDDQINAYQLGTDLYITKPFHPRQVLATIQNLIKKRNQLKDYFTSSLSAVTVKDGIELHQEDEAFLDNIISYVEKNIDDETLNPNSIAEAMGLSKATLYRKLRDLTQKTPSEFVRSIRLSHASQLLISTKMTVQEVMFKSGFTNKSYFYREFAKQYSASPNEYRQNKTK